jgi:hypothetical protein
MNRNSINTLTTPWSQSVDGVELLKEIRELFNKFVVLPDCAADFLALWILHTHCIAAADHTPYVAVMSQDPECGKTTVMKLLAALSRKPRAYSDISASQLFRVIDEEEPTLLVDELDAFLRGNNENYHAMRGILNSGFERSVFATVGRLEEINNGDGGKKFTAGDYSTFCPKALASIQHIPDTVRSRSVVVWMQKNNRIQLPRATSRRIMRETDALRRKIQRWADDNIDTLTAVEEPRKMPRQLSNRAYDRWCPLIAIADQCGGPWRGRARHVARTLEQGNYTPSTGVQLLIDVRDYMQQRGDAEFISSGEVYKYLLKLDQWIVMESGKALTPKALKQMLEGYGVKGKRKMDARGWLVADLEVAFENNLRANADDGE